MLLRTVDGGASWQTSLASGERAVFDDARVLFADEQHGVVAASRVLGPLNRQPAIFVTGDGGASWSVTDSPRSATSRAFLDVAVAR